MDGQNDGDDRGNLPGRVQSQSIDDSARRLSVRQFADSVTEASVRDNTRKAFEDDWKTWELFCRTDGRCLPLEVSEHALVTFAAWLSRDIPIGPGEIHRASAPATIDRRISGVLAGWKSRGLKPERGVGARARDYIDFYTRQLVEANQPTGRGKAQPLTMRDLRKVIKACPDTLSGTRDAALVLVGFAIAARRSELSHLDVSDITPDQGGMLVHVRFSKTKPRRPAVPPGQNPETCPVRVWQRWVEASGIDAGAAFRAIDRHGNLGDRMSGTAIGDIITRAGKRAGVRITGHSLRSGLATEARRAGHDVTTISAQGGWKASGSAVHEYIRIADQFTDNALVGIGL